MAIFTGNLTHTHSFAFKLKKKWKYVMENKSQWKIWLSLKKQFVQNTVTMEQNIINYGLENAHVEIRKKNTDNIIKSNKCNQCDYASSQTGHLRTHLKTHSGEKSNKCNQCDYACSDPSSFRRHLKQHSGEKSNKCNQCDYASSRAGHLRQHLKTHSGGKTTK